MIKIEVINIFLQNFNSYFVETGFINMIRDTDCKYLQWTLIYKHLKKIIVNKLISCT